MRKGMCELMDTVKLEKKQVKMIAHRGLSGIERENTNAAFVAAGNRSYFGIETDVHKTADGRFVILHDETTLRVTEGAVDIDVEQQPYSAVADLCLPDRTGRIRKDLKIPLLDEYIRICKQYEKVCVLELKNAFTREDLVQIVSIIRQEGYLEQVIFISFVLENCTIIRELLPQQPVQWLLKEEITDEILETLCRYRLDVDNYYQCLNEASIAKLHERDILVNCWTCDDPAEAEVLIRAGIDQITSNILE